MLSYRDKPLQPELVDFLEPGKAKKIEEWIDGVLSAPGHVNDSQFLSKPAIILPSDAYPEELPSPLDPLMGDDPNTASMEDGSESVVDVTSVTAKAKEEEQTPKRLCK